MHTFWLTFDSVHREKQFDQRLAADTRRDRLDWGLNFFIQCLVILRNVADGHKDFFAFPLLGSVLTAAGSVVVAALFECSTKETWWKSRTRIITIWRWWSATCLAIHTLYLKRSIPADVVRGVSAGFAFTGGAMSIMCTYTHPMKFKHHLIMIMGVMHIMMIIDGDDYCQCAVDLPGGQQFINLGRGLEMIVGFATVMLWGFDPLARSHTDLELCLQLGAFVYLYFGVVIVSYLVWKAELSARIGMLDGAAMQGNVDIEVPRMEDYSWNSRVCSCLIFLATLSTAWDAAGALSKYLVRRS